MVLPPFTFIVDPTMNVRGGNTILYTSGVPKNYSSFYMITYMRVKGTVKLLNELMRDSGTKE